MQYIEEVLCTVYVATCGHLFLSLSFLATFEELVTRAPSQRSLTTSSLLLESTQFIESATLTAILELPIVVVGLVNRSHSQAKYAYRADR